MTSRQAVAISTTGDEHRLKFLETCVQWWDSSLSPGDSLFVTVDGDEAACERVREAVFPWTGSVFRVGQRYSSPVPLNELNARVKTRETGKIGVAANKNTGLELMMDKTDAEHLFLCDDDTYPLNSYALSKHTELAERIPHSMVIWGGHRLQHLRTNYATWTWPRGVMLYQTRAVVEKVGGMHEGFGIGGHEHAEYSRRIHQAGLTPAPFITPRYMGENSPIGKASRAMAHWHCEDMKQRGETSVELGHRRKQITTLGGPKDWSKANELMDYLDGNTRYVPFRAHQNRRASATLFPTSTGRGAGGDL